MRAGWSRGGAERRPSVSMLDRQGFSGRMKALVYPAWGGKRDVTAVQIAIPVTTTREERSVRAVPLLPLNASPAMAKSLTSSMRHARGGRSENLVPLNPSTTLSPPPGQPKDRVSEPASHDHPPRVYYSSTPALALLLSLCLSLSLCVYVSHLRCHVRGPSL